MKSLIKPLTAAMATAFIVGTTLPANAESGMQLGKLTCEVAGGAGFVFGSSKNLTCDFEPANSEYPVETYTGQIDRYGIDIGVTDKAIIHWAVIAAEADKYAPGALAGTYGGATASATFAVGLGGNVLLGGSADSFALQPLSVSTSQGVNVAAGLAQMTLRK